MLTPPRRRLAALAGALVLPLALAACGGGVAPGQAAQVDGESISVQQVDDLARVICATQGEQSGTSTPTAAIRALALNVLLDIRAGQSIGDVSSVDQRQVSQNMQAAEQARRLVDEGDRALFDQVVRDQSRAQLAVVAEAAKQLRAAGQDPSDQNALQQQVAKLQADYLAKAHVQIAPRFGTLRDGRLVAGDGSLSVPVSKKATSFKGGSSDDPFGTGSTADYPASQRCS
jgi:hypothetical protein